MTNILIFVLTDKVILQIEVFLVTLSISDMLLSSHTVVTMMLILLSKEVR